MCAVEIEIQVNLFAIYRVTCPLSFVINVLLVYIHAAICIEASIDL